MELREFLYLDEELVNQFVSQLDFGLVDSERITHANARSKDGKVSARVVEGGAGLNSSEEVIYDRALTPEAKFNRLFDNMNALTIDPENPVAYSDLKNRSFVALDCEISIPTVGKLIAQVDEIAPLGSLMSVITGGSDPKVVETMEQMQAFGEMAGKPIIAIGEVEHGLQNYFFKLNLDYLRTDLDGIECDAVVVGKVERKWPEGERHSLVNIPGMSLMNRKTRRKLLQQQEDVQPINAEMETEGPGASLRVIAIYR
ncbi:hypothetical protein M3B15_08610 [Corynebacterium sanguinis]|uniref:DUF6414 family protein n=1 Tax=Corynebacterium sanguinis TaxID=2594913 RepID=UPI00223BEC83|nr:hypothetical protein [Corynebacterium sanguinis]MCT1664637.1 hypothetical protein [Corynebacterium sanguinis]